MILIVFLAIPENQPVILGVPPPANSHFTHGHRKFLGKKKDEDRAGLPRLVLLEAGSSKRKGASSKSKELPPLKKSFKRKAKAASTSSSESSNEVTFQQENDDDDDMFIPDDDLKPTKTDVKSSRTNALDIPFFSNSPRATRSTREKQQLQRPSTNRKEENPKKASKKGDIFIHLSFSHLLNAHINSCLGSIRGG